MKPREPKPPASFLRSRAGTPAKVCRTARTDARGRWLYRLRYSYSVLGSRTWTLEALLDLRARWIQKKPSDLKLRPPT